MKPLGWPRLREYQKKAAWDLSSGQKHGLWVFAGAGKSAAMEAAILLANILPPWLIVTRAIGRHAWPRDAEWVLGPDYPIGVLWAGSRHGKTGKHRDGTYTDLDLLLSENIACVTNYDILTQRSKELLAIPWRCLILDEAHAIKGGYQRPERHRDGTLVRSRFHWVKELAITVQGRGGPVWEMTATPIRNRRRDLWSQLDIVLPGAVIPGPNHPERSRGWNILRALNGRRASLGLPDLTMSNFYETLDHRVCLPGPFGVPLAYPEIFEPVERASSFLRRYCGAEQGRYGLVHDMETMSEELADRLSLYFTKLSRQDVAAELPAVQRDAKTVDPSTKQIPRKYQGGGLEQAIARSAWLKIPAALDLIGDHVGAGDRVVVVTSRRALAHETFDQIEKEAKKWAPAIRRDLTLQVVTGEVDVRRRVAMLGEFNMGKGPGVLVATMESMSESVDLHYIPAVVVLALPYTPGAVDQFEGRFARLGGVPVTIYYLIADGTVDMRVRELLRPKLVDVVRLGTDTAAARANEEALANVHDTETILSELRSFLIELGEFEEE